MVNSKRHVVLIVHNVRSCHNVGSLFRTADGLGVVKLWLTGYTPYPTATNDTRLPHLASKVTAKIHKTALGAETSVPWQRGDLAAALTSLRQQHYRIIALEQAPGAVAIDTWAPAAKTAIIVGNEVTGLEPAVLKKCDQTVMIPMKGQKESFNVVQAAAMALFHVAYFKH